VIFPTRAIRSAGLPHPLIQNRIRIDRMTRFKWVQSSQSKNFGGIRDGSSWRSGAYKSAGGIPCSVNALERGKIASIRERAESSPRRSLIGHSQ
jgi:hypothetical protein